MYLLLLSLFLVKVGKGRNCFSFGDRLGLIYFDLNIN